MQGTNYTENLLRHILKVYFCPLEESDTWLVHYSVSVWLLHWTKWILCHFYDM